MPMQILKRSIAIYIQVLQIPLDNILGHEKKPYMHDPVLVKIITTMYLTVHLRETSMS